MKYHQSDVADLRACRKHRYVVAAASFLLVIALWWPVVAGAQDAAMDKQDQLREMYEQLLLNPADLDKTFAYAALAEELGDYEAAIAPLERLLLSYPNASKIKLKLGDYYQKLGAHLAAQTYFEEVAGDAGADLADKALAKTRLEALPKAEAQSL